MLNRSLKTSRQNSPAAMAQIEPNSQILAIDGKNAPDWETINLLLTDKLGSDSVELTLTPFGEDQPYQRTINLQNWTFEPDKETSFETLGINPVSSKVNMTLSKVVENSPAEKAGLLVGDKNFSRKIRPHLTGKLLLHWYNKVNLLLSRSNVIKKFLTKSCNLRKIEMVNGLWG